MLTALTLLGFFDVGGGGLPTIEIDPFNLEWWQQIAILLGALGLSPAPWILGLAIGRIQFTKAAAEAHQREIAARQEAHQRELETREEAHQRELDARQEFHKALMDAHAQRYAEQVEATEMQRVRADGAIAALGQSTLAIEASNHIISEFISAAKGVEPDAR